MGGMDGRLAHDIVILAYSTSDEMLAAIYVFCGLVLVAYLWFFFSHRKLTQNTERTWEKVGEIYRSMGYEWPALGEMATYEPPDEEIADLRRRIERLEQIESIRRLERICYCDRPEPEQKSPEEVEQQEWESLLGRIEKDREN